MARSKQIAGVILAAVLLPMSLTGCIRTNADVQISNEGDVGTAVVQIGVNKDIAEKAGIYNLAGFETYIQTTKKIDKGDTCAFSEDSNEYTMDCRNANVVDNTGAFTGITASTSGGNLIVTARDGALTDDLAEYDPSGMAVGSIMLYFDGDIQSVSAPKSTYRMPSSGVIAFDLKDGKFFNDNVMIVVKPHSSNMALFVVLGVAALIVIALAFALTRKKKASNPFTSDESTEATKKATPAAAGGLVTAADQKAAMAAKDKAKQAGEETPEG